MVGGVLGFNAATKKSDVGAYFKKVKETVEGTKTALNKIVADMKEKGNPNASATESEVNKLVKEKLDKIIEGAKTVNEAIGDSKDEIGNIATQGQGGVAGGADVDKLVEGIKGIVGIVLGTNEGNADAGTAKKADALSADRGNTAKDGEAGKLFGGAVAGDASNTKKVAADAAKAVGAVTGADILKAMVKDGGDAAKLAKEKTGNTAKDAPKDATIAGAIALRAMSKDGKFAGPESTAVADYTAEIKGVAVRAVTKALDTLTIAIRKTIDDELKKVKEAMKINANDNPVINENGAAVK